MYHKTISDFAKLCEVGVETLRYYQRKGLLCPVAYQRIWRWKNKMLKQILP